MKVLGVDPGTAVLGYGVVESGSGPHPRLLEGGILTTRIATTVPERLHELSHGEGIGGGDEQVQALNAILDKAEIKRRFPHINVLGGCCGTDHRHVDCISTACRHAA